MMNKRQNEGFTLIELVIVLAVVAILAAIVYPSYQDSIRKARRADAMNAITAIQLNQVNRRANAASFTNTLADVWGGGSGGANSSVDGYYTMSLSGASATAFTITATPSTKGGQNNDSCGNLVLAVSGGTETRSASAGDDDHCWQR